MSVLNILEWIMTSNSVVSAVLLIMFPSSLLYILLRGTSR